MMNQKYQKNQKHLIKYLSFLKKEIILAPKKWVVVQEAERTREVVQEQDVPEKEEEEVGDVGPKKLLVALHKEEEAQEEDQGGKFIILFPIIHIFYFV